MLCEERLTWSARFSSADRVDWHGCDCIAAHPICLGSERSRAGWIDGPGSSGQLFGSSEVFEIELLNCQVVPLLESA